MRVLFATTPAVGHVHPVIPFASAAVAGGHDVAFATSPGMARMVERSGFKCFPIGANLFSPQEADQQYPQMRGALGKDRAALAWQNLFAGHYPKANTAGLIELARTWRPDIIVHDDVNFGACIAAERLGLSYAAVQTVAFRPHLYALVRDELDERRREVGLPADADGKMPFRHLFLSPFPRSYLNPDVALPAASRSVRPVPFDRSGSDALPDWVARLTGWPLVYLTLGTVFNYRADIFSAFIDGLRDEPVELVVTIGRDQDPSQFGPQPANVHVERYVPQTLLFPHCALVVSHAGSGTIMAALTNALPMVLIPISADQPENAERCVALGIARVLPAADLTPEMACGAVTDVLGDPSYRQASIALRDEIDALPGPEFALELLEELVAESLRPDTRPTPMGPP